MFRIDRFSDHAFDSSPSTLPLQPRLIVVLALDGCPLLDATGSLQAFATANDEVLASGDTDRPYEIIVASLHGGLIPTACRVELVTRSVAEISDRRIDTLLVVGGDRDARTQDPAVVAWVRAQRPRVRRVASLYTGAFVLAAAGLLDGRRATTHWSFREALRRTFPNVRVETDALFVEDTGVWTSAGVTSGIDLALAMIEADRGRALSVEIARQLVLFVRRSGAQPQVSTHLRAQAIRDDNLRRLVEWILENPGVELDAEGLAARAHMSLRTLYRAFKEHLNTTPRDFIERVRLEAARRDLEQSEARIDRVALNAGFSSTEAMRRAFKRHLEMTPGDYRESLTAPAARAV